MYRTFLILLVLLALGLRLIRLGEPSLWHDEAISALLALHDPIQIIGLTAQDVHPPLYYLLLHAWLVFGQDEFALRLLSALASTLTVPVIYSWGHELFREHWGERRARQIGLLAATLFVFAPFQLAYAQEARMYSLFVLLCTTSSWLLVRARRSDHPRAWILYALVIAAALYTDYFAVFVIAAHGLWLWLHAPGQLTAALKHWAAAMLLCLILFAPWLLTFITQARAVAAGYWVAPPTILNPLISLHLFLVGHALPGVPLTIIGLFLSLTIVGIIISVLLRAARAETMPALVFLLLAVFLPVGATFIISQVRSIYLDRALLFTAPPLYLLVAWTAQSIRPSVMGRAMLAALVLMMIVGQAAYHLDPSFTKPPVRMVADLLREEVEPGDIVIHTSEGSFLPARYYLPTLPQSLAPDAPDEVRNNAPSQAIAWALGGAPRPVEQAVVNRQRAWLVVMLDHSIAHQLALRAQMEQRFLKTSDRNVGGIQVLLFNLQANAWLDVGS